MKIFIVKRLIWGNAITLAPIGIFIKEGKDTPYCINEEKIHWAQQLEMLIIPFYLWYFIEWVIKALTPPVGAYKSLSFEREAKAFRFDYTYLIYRKHFTWTKYIKK